MDFSLNLKINYAVIAKPIGPVCNLSCKYCYYIEKKKLYKDTDSFIMQPYVMETFIKEFIELQDTPEVQFSWQGGEPTILGVNFFKKVVELQNYYANGKRVSNAIQTNGTLLDDEWCDFFSENAFLVGLSIDGPREMHDHYRIDKLGNRTFDRVMHGLELLKENKVAFNTLTVVNDLNSQYPLEVYRFLKEAGAKYMQFIPLVERNQDYSAKEIGLKLSMPPASGENGNICSVTKWSVKPTRFGKFYSEIFNEWIRQDVGSYFVQFFEVVLNIWLGYGSPLCHFAQRCGNAPILEHNGDIYACDHYVYPQYKIGNIIDMPLKEALESPQQKEFGNSKFDSLPGYCRECEILFACNGGCPKHRFMFTPDGEPGLNYLCRSYKRIFKEMDPYIRVIAQLVRSGRQAAEVMNYLSSEDRKLQWLNAKRNSPCPCGSGKKYKKCCGSNT